MLMSVQVGHVFMAAPVRTESMASYASVPQNIVALPVMKDRRVSEHHLCNKASFWNFDITWLIYSYRCLYCPLQYVVQCT